MKQTSPINIGRSISVSGVVQGVGFRPTVWNLAKQNRLTGSVWNHSSGVTIELWGTAQQIDQFLHQLQQEPPPLAIIEQITTTPLSGVQPDLFTIVESHGGLVTTRVAADAATCPACTEDIFDPTNRRYRYPFTNCTHCGPRLSIIQAIPYDRANTSMSKFTLCKACKTEYEDPADRRFHAQPNCCAECGPRLWLEERSGVTLDGDPVLLAAEKIRAGEVVAIKGLGGFHLACDATNEQAVALLRVRKKRVNKAFAVMAKHCGAIEHFAEIPESARKLLESRSAPIVILDQRVDGEPLTPSHTPSLAPSLAPLQQTVGFMLPYTPLHHLLLDQLDHPIVLTSGNQSSEPQCITNHSARQQLAGIADFWLMHDREIINRVDDSVVLLSNSGSRTLRYARGMAPESIPLPDGFENSPPLLAMGGALKNSFALLRNQGITLSQYIGDLENSAAINEYQHTLQLYQQLFSHSPQAIVVDRHPDYSSSRLGRAWASEQQLPLIEVQHHHAHVASCMVENNISLDHPPVLGITLDGLGYGDSGEIWGGEFLLTGYQDYRRIASFTSVALPGGDRANREPWRNSLAHLLHFFDWGQLSNDYSGLELIHYLQQKPLKTIRQMIDQQINSPLSSSCGRVIDAVTASIGLNREINNFEAESAILLESFAGSQFDTQTDSAYPHQHSFQNDLLTIDWRPLWQAILEDLQRQIAPATIAARFHHGLISALCETTTQLAKNHSFSTVALVGGVFQNRLLLEGCKQYLTEMGYTVLIQSKTPTNDQGIAIGQSAIAAAQQL